MGSFPNFSGRRGIFPLLALGFSLLFPAPIWGKTVRPYEKKDDIQHWKRYEGGRVASQWKTPGGRGEQIIILTRKGRRGQASRSSEVTEERLRHFENLSPEEKARLRRKLRKWKSLSAEEQRALRGRMKQWMELSPEKRRLYEQQFRQWNRLPPEEREWIREKLEKGNALTPQEREQIRRRFKNRD